MKRSIALTIALAVSVISLSLASSDSTAQAQQGRGFVADTGLLTLGPNQILRITVDGKFGPETEAAVRFGRVEYTQGVCNGGVCKHTIASQNISAPVTLMPGEAASFTSHTMPFSDGVRGVVLSNSQDVRVNVMIINNMTGEVNAVLDISPEFRRCSFPFCGG